MIGLRGEKDLGSAPAVLRCTRYDLTGPTPQFRSTQIFGTFTVPWNLPFPLSSERRAAAPHDLSRAFVNAVRQSGGNDAQGHLIVP